MSFLALNKEQIAAIALIQAEARNIWWRNFGRMMDLQANMYTQMMTGGINPQLMGETWGNAAVLQQQSMQAMQQAQKRIWGVLNDEQRRRMMQGGN